MILNINFNPKGDTPDFKWQGWSNGAKNQNPKKSLGLPTKPKKSVEQTLIPQKTHAEFPSLKNFQKALNDMVCLRYLVLHYSYHEYKKKKIPP